MYCIRKAELKDCGPMMELVKELALYEKAPEEVTVTQAHFEASGFGPAPVWWAFVAEYEGRVVAMALYYVRYSTWKGQRMYLEDIIVTEQHRQQGIGRQLMDALMAEASERGFSGISWQVLDWNEPAIQFYKKYPAVFDGAWINVAVQL